VSCADPETARSSLGELARSWGHELAPVSTGTPTPPDLDHDGDTKAVDPLSLAALVLSIPSAALAVVDLADRIKKRRRAMELIDHAHELAERQVEIEVIVRDQPRELIALDADQLLDLLAEEGNDLA
jgi:hypothetical protein